MSYLMFQDIVELESFFRITTDHPPNQILGLGRDKRRNVVDTFFHFFQQLTKIIVVKWQGAHLELVLTRVHMTHLNSGYVNFNVADVSDRTHIRENSPKVQKL